MKKPMLVMLVCVGILFGLIFGWKAFKAIMTKRFLTSMQAPAIVVSTMKVTSSVWQPKLKSVGSIRAIVGVSVTTELAGMVQTIFFKPGSVVEKGDILVQLNAGTEVGLLHSLQAQVELAKITYNRDKAQFAAHAVSKQTVDTDEWTLRNLQAQVEEQAATVDKKTIRAPFNGYLGISKVNPGQYLNVGDVVTTLQSLDPIYVDFFMPQQNLAQLKLDQQVNINADPFPDEKFSGKITTIQPLVSVDTRNVEVEATLANSKLQLKPGMFVNVEIEAAAPLSYLTVPQTAISFNPYGNLIYIVKDSGKKDDKNQPVLTANQVFVTVGDTRGDQIAVLKGVKEGDIIVTSGQLKLKNGSVITINNTVQPSNDPAPKVHEK